MKRTLLAFSAAAAMVVGAAGQAHAALISSASVNYNGAVFTLEYHDTALGVDQYDVRYLVDFTNFTPGTHESFIWGVNLKPSLGNLTSIVSVDTNATGSWNYFVDVNLSANGCSGGGAEFACGEESLPSTNATTGSYYWNFVLGITGVGDNPEAMVFSAPIRALFTNNETNPSGKYFASLMSLQTPSDGAEGGQDGGGTDGNGPEPATLALFGAALALVGARLRRKQ